MSSSASARTAWALFALACVLAAAEPAAVGILSSRGVTVSAAGVGEVVASVGALAAFGVFGALVVRRFPRNPVGWLMVVAALGTAISGASDGYASRALAEPSSLPYGRWIAWVASWSPTLSAPLAGTLLLLLFPTGRLPSQRWRPVLWLSVGSLVAMLLGLSLAVGPLSEFSRVRNPLGVVPEGLANAFGGVWLLAVALCVASLVVRYRRSEGDERQQLRWIAAAGVVFLASVGGTFALDSLSGSSRGWPLEIGLAFVVAAAGLAILRYRLYELDLVVNRTLVYAVLTGGVIAGYLGFVALLGTAAAGPRLGVSILAVAAVAVAAQPLRVFVQRRVNRLMYGDRDDPHRAVRRLGDRLGQALDPDEALPTIVEAVREALRLPYAAIEFEEAGQRRITSAAGAHPGGELVRVPLENRGERIGTLVVAARRTGERLGGADLRLLTDLARHAGVVVHSVRLTEDLRRSRERLVSAREEERRRLRRDLHDGLGSSLAGIALEAEAALGAVDRDPERARALLRAVAEASQAAIADIRRIAHDLRPPVLDQLGLVAAIHEQATRLTATMRGRPLDISVEAPELPPLPAAVEVAAYRIALEALTNVVRHSDASTCTVQLTLNGRLELEVADNGNGLGDALPWGVGLVSMRERADEVGGELLVESTPGTGARVRALLPLELE